MSIQQRLDDDLKAAMRAKDSAKVSSIRQVKAKLQETITAKGFSGEVDDALWEKTISSYVRSLEKGIEELTATGERGEALRGQYEGEITYLGEFLPKKLGETETRQLVAAAVAELGVSDPKQAGKVMGALMKAHKSTLDAALAKRILDEHLG